MRYVYLKNGDAVDQARRILAGSDERGGPDGFIGDFMRAHLRDELLVLCNWKSRDSYSLGRVRAESFPIEGRRRWRPFWRLRCALQIGAAMFRFRPDRILCACSGELLWISVLVAKLRGVPIVNSRHITFQERKGLARIVPALDRASILACDGVVCHGRFLLDQMHALGVPAARTREFGVDFGEFAELAARAESPPALLAARAKADFVMMFVGRVQRDKGIFDLLEAFRLMPQPARSRTILVYVGEGKDLEDLACRVRDWSLSESVVLLGHVPYRQLAGAMRQATVVLAPTRPEFGEGRCKVVPESLVLGVPVIAPNFGPFPYGIRAGVDGLLFAPADPVAMSACMTRIVTEPQLLSTLRAGAAESALSLKSTSTGFAKAVEQAFAAQDRRPVTHASGPRGEGSAMRMLIVAKDKFPPFRVDVSVLFARELAARGFAMDWLMQAEKADSGPVQCAWGGGTAWVGATDEGQSRWRRLHKHWLALRHDFKVFELTRRGDYDIVQVRDKALAALFALRAARRHGAAFVYWLSFPAPEASLYLARIGAARYPWLYRVRGWLMFRLLYRFILPRADHIFVQSEQMKADLVGYGIPAQTMTSVPMGIDLKDFEDFAAPTAPAADAAPVIGYLGTLAGERRIDFLVRVLELVRRSRPDARLLLVGGGDRPGDEDRIRAEAKRLGVLDHVEITGFLKRSEALLRIAGTTVCASPFYPTPILRSTSPTKLVEYMSLGKAVVANDHPEQRLVLEQSRAGICVAYDEAAFAAAILRILADPEETQDMGRRGRRYVEAHRDYRRIADAVAREYRNLVARTPRGQLGVRV